MGDESFGIWDAYYAASLMCSISLSLPVSYFHNICLNFLLLLLCCISLWSKKPNENNCFLSVTSVCCASHTSLFQSHHGGLLYQVPLYEAPEILAVHAEVWQLECVDGHLERELLVGTLAGHLEPRQGDDSGAGVGDPAGETLLWKDRGGGFEDVSRERKRDESMLRSPEYLGHCPPASARTACRSCWRGWACHVSLAACSSGPRWRPAAGWQCGPVWAPRNHSEQHWGPSFYLRDTCRYSDYVRKIHV